jgi:hypothetical protein
MSEFSKIDNGPEADYIEEGGVRRYGRKVGEVAASELSAVEVPSKTLLHITRHLSTLAPEARARLRGLQVFEGEGAGEVDDEFIDAELASTGSKFHRKIDQPETISTFAIEQVLAAVQAGESVVWVRHPHTKEQEAIFSIEVTPQQKALLGLARDDRLGTLSLIPITPEIADNVHKEQRGTGEERDQIEINVVEGMTVPQTDQLIVSLMRSGTNDPVWLHTTFTGIHAPALPREHEQTLEEFDYNREWWDRHAFIK